MDESPDLYKERKKEASIVLLISHVYRIAILDNYPTIELRQKAASSGDRLERLVVELDTTGIRKDLREELDLAYTKIKTALQIGGEIIKSLGKSATGFEAIEPI